MAINIRATRVVGPPTTGASVSAVLAGSMSCFARLPTVTTAAPSGPITITTGGTYTGTYQSTDPNVPVITISTTAPVTLLRARIIQKGRGVWAYNTKGTQLTIIDCIFEQQDPGIVVFHRAVETDQPKSFIFQNNIMTDTDGVIIHSLRTLTVDPLIFNNNVSINNGRYPCPTGSGNNTFVALDNVVAPTAQISWNKVLNVPGQSLMEDNISLFQSGGLDTTHRIDIAHNLIDGAYPRVPGSDSGFTGGGINLGDAGSAHSTAHDNVVVSCTNYGISVAFDDNYAYNDLLINDGVEQTSDFGDAIVAGPSISPPGVHATNFRYNWVRGGSDPNQYPCYPSAYGSGTQVSMTEQQARNEWEAKRAAANMIVGPRPTTPINRPTNPALINYIESGQPGEVTVDPANWAHPGALVLTGRTNYNDSWVQTVAAGGATVLIYLDAIISDSGGRYHDKLINASEFGAAVPHWPGDYQTSTGIFVNDFRTTADGGGGVLQSKLAGVLQLAITENPHISGFFLDDVGTWIYYGGVAFSGWTAAEKLKFRNGAIAICQTARTLADANNLFLLVNGTWMAGQGGGYPDAAQHGCSLVDGGGIENHSEDAFWAGYANSAQWGAATPRRLPYGFAVGNSFTSADKDAWLTHCSHVQFGSYAGGTPAPWGAFTDLGLPRRASTPTAPVKEFGFSVPQIRSQTNTVQQQWLSDMASMGVKWIRFEMYWPAIQTTSAPSYTFTAFDTLVQNCANAGIKIVAMLGYTPDWARAAGTTQFNPPTNLNNYATFAAACVSHYGNAVAAWEIWNEPNIGGFWQPTPNVALYTQMLIAAANAMRAVDPNVFILTAGNAPAATSGGNYAPIDFVTGIYANGGKPYFSALGHHPYCYPAVPAEFFTWSAWSVMAQTSPSIRSVMAANGDSGKNIWMTEAGGPTNGPEPVRGCSDALGPQAHYDECMQARCMQQGISISKTLPWTGPLLFHGYKDIGTDPSSNENFFGVIDFNGVHKQAYNAVKLEITGQPVLGPVFGSAGTAMGGSAATSAPIPVPAGVAVDDIVLAMLYVETTQAVTPPAGFTEAPDSPVVVTGTQAHDLHVYWKRATGADTGTYAFTIAAGLAFRAGGAVRFTGCVTSGNPFDVTASAIKTTTADGTTPAVSDTTIGPNRLWVWVGTDFNGGSCSVPPGFIERFDPGSGCIAVDSMDQVTAGSSGSVTATFTTNGASAAWLGALLPV